MTISLFEEYSLNEVLQESSIKKIHLGKTPGMVSCSISHY